MEPIKPKRLQKGDTIGIFTPSEPSYQLSEEVFKVSVENLKKCGFKVKLGKLTAKRSSQGYRSGTPQQRAAEFMDLIEDPGVDALMATIGGSNSNSMLPLLDYDAIRARRKIIIGYSDVTSLHLGILEKAGLRTILGAALMPTFFDAQDFTETAIDSFLTAVGSKDESYPKELVPFPRWSDHFRDWMTDEWKTEPRIWKQNTGWTVLNKGTAEGRIIVANLNTMLCLAGTSYFPDLRNKILVIEEMAAPYSRLERNLNQIRQMNGFDQLKGLIFGKIEQEKPEGAPFNSDQLLMEVVGDLDIPVVSNFDCAHTKPMLSLGQLAQTKLEADEGLAKLFLLEEFVI